MGQTKTAHTIVQPQDNVEDVSGNIDDFLSTLARWVVEDLQSKAALDVNTEKPSERSE